jgi:hypothetical protein
MPKKNKSVFNLTKEEYLKKIARETAKMSYPGAMSMQRNGKQIVIARTKKALEEYFVNEFPIEDLWDQKEKAPTDYDGWHGCQTKNISKKVVEKRRGNKKNNSDAISAKLLNTFMHQLMKYEKFRYLYKYLHVPLDKGAFNELSKKLGQVDELEVSKKQKNELKKLNALVSKYCGCPYSTDSKDYIEIQKGLLELVKIWNKCLSEFEIKARIDLNCILWPK